MIRCHSDMPQIGQLLKPLWIQGESDEDCWNWIGSVNKRTGYGKKQFDGKTLLAHRWMYQNRVGTIPVGMVINHICRNRKCVNPQHLEVVTQAVNCQKGAGTVLNRAHVAEIKAAEAGRRWGDGSRLARAYGVSTSLIHDIWRGRAWMDI